MKRVRANELMLRSLALGLLAAFAVGVASGPLRTCLTHPGHGPGSHDAPDASQHAMGHGAHHADDARQAGHGVSDPSPEPPDGAHDGCTCLGICSLEHAPGLVGAGTPPVAKAFEVPKAIRAPLLRVHVGPAPFDLPLARPPPAVV